MPLLAVIHVSLSWTCTLFITLIKLHEQGVRRCSLLITTGMCFYLGDKCSSNIFLILVLKTTHGIVRPVSVKGIVPDVWLESLPINLYLCIIFLKLAQKISTDKYHFKRPDGYWLQTKGFASPLWINSLQPQIELSYPTILESNAWKEFTSPEGHSVDIRLSTWMITASFVSLINNSFSTYLKKKERKETVNCFHASISWYFLVKTPPTMNYTWIFQNYVFVMFSCLSLKRNLTLNRLFSTSKCYT